MSRISGRRPLALRPTRSAGFTMVELMVATALSAIVLAAILAAYLFVGRNLTRLVNTQEQEVKSRRALHMFTSDISAATNMTAVSSSGFTLTKQGASGTTTVSYAYSSGNRTLTRTEGTASFVLVSDINAFALEYYNEAGSTVSSNAQSVKSVEISFTTAVGNSSIGTLATYTTVSPRVVLRNKSTLK